MARPFKSFAHEEPHELVKRIPLGSKLCRNGRGGPWIARTPFGPGVRSRKVYVGSDANKAIVEQAWSIVGEWIAALEETPEVRKLRELEALGRPGVARAEVVPNLYPTAWPGPPMLHAVGTGRGGGRRPKR